MRILYLLKCYMHILSYIPTLTSKRITRNS